MKNVHLAVLIYLLFIAPFRPLSAQTNVQRINVTELIDSLTSTLDNYYVFPEKAELINKHLRQQLIKKAYEGISDPMKLSEKLLDDIRSVHTDPHMRIYYDSLFTNRNKGEQKPSAEEIEELKRLEKEQNYLFKKVEVLPGNIGYLLFNGFSGDIEGSKSTVSSALKFLINTTAIIIDLRSNGGGSPEMVSYIESYFFQQKTHMNDIIDRLSKDTSYFYADPAKTAGITLKMPVYILTSKRTFSGAEDFSYGMQSVKRAIIVGETTGGGAHPTKPFLLGQGFQINVPFARSLNPYTKTDWEGTGVKPDIQSSANEALKITQTTILQKQLAGIKDEQQKRKIQWAIDRLSASEEFTLSSETHNLFPSTYTGGLNFYVEKDKILCKNNERGGEIFELKPIKKSLFTLDENAHVEFIKDKSGKISSIKLLFENGRIVDKPRIN
ncbi:S41 family peptidase [Olivibacter domesticus]|uniref:N-terminal domain of Peptidase_S41 n=1 Tax=Olivibacter domesticus TaxID=407022 RepID=A0A1H7SA28_OLID1|nr:S41 family peptidase [Olivibacter domesticus]SEL68397.1 N-terminal domain of Peptidase_S41 [Olivibacter domesticus]